MRYLPFNSVKEAQYRNSFEAFRRGCHPPTLYWWTMETINGISYLHVLDGNGCTAEELERTVTELPTQNP
jgi:hypothetical protein